MKIDRGQLVPELAAFAVAGNGLIVGQPGVGKSYTLAALRDTLKSAGIPHLVLPVERLGRGTAADLRAILRKDGDFVELLRSAAPSSKRPAILIFDGFDAARGENERAGVFQLILRAVNELRGQWNTIVSVRSFDAKKSQRLLELFPENDTNDTPATSSCRQFSIPPLNPQELEQAFGQIPGLRELHSGGRQEFRTLLTVPFNLWLVERILLDGAKANEFSHVTSEVQLLEMYWRYRVRRAPHAEAREFILKSATQEMVKDHTLAVRRDKVYHPSAHVAWESLFSDEILCEVAEREAHVTFTHNILFDFAVSIYLLEPDPARLAQFLAEEPARPLFLRPSLVYHFTRLWHFARDIFWRNFWSVVQRQEMHIRQIVRLVLPAVVVTEAQNSDDLKPLLERLGKKEPFASEAVAFLLQALRVLQSPKRSLWAQFICAIGEHLDQRFAWDAGLLATGIVETKEAPHSETLADCGKYGRSLLRWAWSARADKEKGPWFERLAGFIAVPLVAKTYSTNKGEARPLIEEVIKVIGEPDFPIDCIYRLANEIGQLIPHDPELVGLIYERVFGYEEESSQVTNKGGPVMSFSMSRRDDYGMCRYSLMKEFPRFLAANPPAALLAGIRAIQAFAIRDHVLRYLEHGKTWADLTTEFQFRQFTALYVEDGSAIWGASSYPDRELEIADRVFSWLSDVAKAGRKVDADTFLDIFSKQASLAFLWSRLLAVGREHPATLGPDLWELAKAMPILAGNDCLYAVGAFLERASEYFSKDRRQQIEHAILDLPKGESGEKAEFLVRRRNRLIARIPAQFLVTEEATALRSTLESAAELPPNEPLFRFSASSRSLTEDDFLREQGAKLESPANQKLRELYKPLKEWGEKKDETQIEVLLPSVCALREALRNCNDVDTTVVRAAWMHLAAFGSDAVLRTNSATTDRFRILRGIVLEAAGHPVPEPNPKHDSEWKSASWSPAPRNDAAQALPWLTHFGEDKEALAAIQKLVHDPVPSVRFLLMCELWRLLEHCPDFMWSILEEVADNETNDVVMQGVMVSLWELVRRARERSVTLIAKLLQRVEDESGDDEKPQSHLVCMVADYAAGEDNKWAKETIGRWQGKPVEFASQVATSGRRLLEHVKPEHSGTQLERARDLLLQHLDAAAHGLTRLSKEEASMAKDEIQKKWRLLYGVIDETVMRIYFAADIDPNLRERKEHPLDDEARMKFFRDVLPLLEKVLSLGKQPETGILLAPTAHHFMELLNGVLHYDPALVLRIAADVVICSKRFNYNLDSLALGEVVKLVESILADYRDKVQDEVSVNHLLEVLDAFVEAGWPEALNLVWRLDEIYR